MTNLDWEAFREHFGSYAGRIKPAFDEGILDNVYASLKSASRRGRRCAPDSDRVFWALRMTPIDQLKAVLVGIAPYPSEVDGKKIADGLMLGASGMKEDFFPPSLESFYNGLENELGIHNYHKTNDMNYLAYQGVLMWNIGLTCELYKTASHNDLWEPFQKFFFQEIIGPSQVPVVFMGKDTYKFKRWLNPLQHHFLITHPVEASYNQTVWNTDKTFTKVNKITKSLNGYEINWLPTKEEWESIMCPF